MFAYVFKILIMETIKEIDKRYTGLSESNCCLSCGGAIDLAKPKPGEICIDLGSGRGTDVLRLAEIVGETGFVYGIDASEGMIAKAESNAQKFNVKNVKFARAVLENIPIESEKVDLVISNCTINHAIDKLVVWQEIYRVLKYGGHFVISDIYATQEVPDEFRNDPVAVAECWAGAVTKDDYITHLLKAGFREFNIVEESSPYKKGKIEVCSFTVSGTKTKSFCCC